MKKLKYIFTRIRKMHFDKMFKRVNEVSKESHKLKIIIFFDMIYCGFKYQAGYEDYHFFKFHTLSRSERKTYITRGIVNSIISKYNNNDYMKYFDNKALFLDTFKDYISREYINVKELDRQSFEDWVKKHGRVIYKPLEQSGGYGIEFLCSEEITNYDESYNRLIVDKSALLEEVIIQHPQISALYDGSINTMRIVTLLDDEGKTHIIYACLRIGAEGESVDNLSRGGMTSRINIDKGELMYDAENVEHEKYTHHPVSKIKFIGYKIPMWKECMNLVKESSKLVPQLRYVGWDLAITKDKPILVEGNTIPGHGMMQMPSMIENKTGMLPIIEEITHTKFY